MSKNQPHPTSKPNIHGNPVLLSLQSSEVINPALIASHYPIQRLVHIIQTAWDHLLADILSTTNCHHALLQLPYYPSIECKNFVHGNGDKQIAIDLYVTDPIEAKALNQQSRGKNYPTNILSYPSDLPRAVQALMDELPLGELVLCHDVICSQANEQNKTTDDHLAHLLVHGLLHLLGFDHELGQDEQQQMENLEIAILANMGIYNPYE